MEIEKHSPKWLLNEIRNTESDAHALFKIIEFQKALTEQCNIANVVESKPNEKDALKHAVEAIYFADNSDYLSGLYGVVRSLTGLDEPTEEDIKKLYKELRFE